MAGRVFGTRTALRFVHNFSQEGTSVGYPVLRDNLCELFANVQLFTLNFGIHTHTGQDGGTQHASRFAGVYGHLEGEADRR